jgi:hypothetical protein
MTKQLIFFSSYWWPTIDEDIRYHAEYECKECMLQLDGKASDTRTILVAYNDSRHSKLYQTKKWYYAKVSPISVKPLRWHDTLALMKVDLIHKAGHYNMMGNKLSKWKSSKQ